MNHNLCYTVIFSENRCTVEASFLDAELKLLNQTISIICNNPSELHQLRFHIDFHEFWLDDGHLKLIGRWKNENLPKQDIISSLSLAKAKFQATIQKNDAHINVLLG